MAGAGADISNLEPAGPLWADAGPDARQAMLTEILARVSREALQGEDLQAVLQAIVDCLVQRLPVTIASIILLNEPASHFIHEVWAGALELNAASGDWPVTRGAAGRCARTGQPQLITEVDADPDYMPGNLAVRSEYLIPIRHRQRLHGVLNLESTRVDFFTREARAAFEAIADQIAGAIHLARVVSELEAANRKLRRLSMSDGLTGIANRRAFDEALTLAWERAEVERAALALLLVDADCFKLLNDRLGHLYGDECLRYLAQLCAEAAEAAGGLAARYGGEELALLLPGRALAEARRIGEALRQRVEQAALAHPHSTVAPHVTVSIGIASAQPAPGVVPEQLIAAADRALYMAKARGRNGVVARHLDAGGAGRPKAGP